jgi:hypothetical protein
VPRTVDSTLRWKGTSDYVAYTAASASSNAIPEHVHEVRLVASTRCHINIGQAGGAAAATDNNGIALPADTVEYFHISPGQVIHVIRDSADGVLSIAYMTR